MTTAGFLLRLRPTTHVLVLTGAGVSAESGIATFRGVAGMWENEPLEAVASPEGFAADPLRVWRFYSERRSSAAPCVPNAGHLALVELEQKLRERFLLVTQNVDGLHRNAGNERMIELHGNLFTTRCSDCQRSPFEDINVYRDELPRCGECKGLLRPHIVWFGEALDTKHLDAVTDFMERAAQNDFIFLAAGTSGSVWPAAGFAGMARQMGARTVLVNADPAENGRSFDDFVRGKSGEILPTLFSDS